jgi:hypothetical protein
MLRFATQKFVAYERRLYGGSTVPVYGTVKGGSVEELGAYFTPEVAAQQLQVAARLIRQGEPLPPSLRERVAGAFESLLALPTKKTANNELLLRLGLRKGTPGAPLSNWLEIGAAVEAMMQTRPGKAKLGPVEARRRVAEARGMALEDVRNRHRKYRVEKLKKRKKG